MTGSKKAIQYLRNGFNCSQSVLTSFSGKYKIPEDQCLKIACAFGAGMGRQQHTCGAVTGAMMVLGLHYGRGKHDDPARKILTYEKTTAFIKAFTETHGSICCLELLEGLHMNDPEDLKKIEERELFRTKCTRYVADAVEIAEKLIGDRQD